MYVFFGQVFKVRSILFITVKFSFVIETKFVEKDNTQGFKHSRVPIQLRLG